MNVIGYNESGSIRVIFEGDEAESIVPDVPGNRHRQAIAEWESEGNEIPAYVPPPPPVVRPQPSMFAAAAVCIADGAVSAVELAAQLQSAFYEDGWVIITFSEEQDPAGYLIFAQTDLPARVEQFKSGGYFELVFTDPATGDPVEPGRIDLQILKVR